MPFSGSPRKGPLANREKMRHDAHMIPFHRLPLFTLLLCLAVCEAYAHSFTHSALRSPIWLHEGKVVFTQPDGSLTILNAETGAVIHRIAATGELRALWFEAFGDDIVGMGGGGVFCVDGNAGTVKWRRGGETPLRFDALSGPLIVVANPNHTLAAYDVSTGETVWTKNLGEYVSFDAVGGRLYAFHGFFHDYPHGASRSFLSCLDPESGRELWRETASEKESWVKIALFETSVHVLATEAGLTVRNRLISWTRDGEPRPSPPLDPEDVGKRYRNSNETLLRVGGDAYTFRRAPIPGERSWSEFTPGEIERFGLCASAYFPQGGMRLDGGGVLAVSGVVPGWGRTTWDFFNRYSPYLTHEKGRLDRRFHFLDGDISWIGEPGYFNVGYIVPKEGVYERHDNYLDNAASDGRHVVVATSFGQMECLDRVSGASRWLYLYPTRRREFSIPFEWPLFMVNAGGYLSLLRGYEDANMGIGVTGTVRRDYGGEKPEGGFFITVDPKPTHWHFPSGVTLAIMLTILGVVPLILMPFLMPGALRGIFAKREKRDDACLSAGSAAATPSSVGFRYLCVLCAIGFVYNFLSRAGFHSPLSLLPLESILYSMLCAIPYRAWATGERRETGRVTAVLVLALFFPFAFWGVYGVSLLSSPS